MKWQGAGLAVLTELLPLSDTWAGALDSLTLYLVYQNHHFVDDDGYHQFHLDHFEWISCSWNTSNHSNQLTN